jgi:hypothetical protein
VADFQRAHRQWVEEALTRELVVREDRWSEAIAVGSGTFVEKVKSELGVRATHREIVEVDRTYGLREPSQAYGSEFASENEALMLKNTIQWQKNAEIAQT